MRYARDDRTKKIVDAYDVDGRIRFRAYSCPNCAARVHYKRSIGLSPDPIFAHNPHESSPDCENYYPWQGGHRPTPAPVPAAARPQLAVEDSPEEVGLCLEDAEEWTIYMRVPELTRSDLGTTSLRSLISAFVEVEAGSQRNRLSLLEIRPGVGSARLVIPPTMTPYKTATIGSWPIGVEKLRWQTQARGLSACGTLFRLRHGEWVRLREGSAVELGEELRVVANSKNPPPAECQPLPRNEVRMKGQVWRMWRVILPNCESRQLGRWLESLEIEAVEPAWKVQIANVPEALAGQVPIFATRRPLVARLRSPNPGTTADITLFTGSGRTAESFPTPAQSKTIFLFFSVPWAGENALTVAYDDRSAVRFDTKEAKGLSDIRNAMKAVPVLEVSIGDTIVKAWDPPVDLSVPSRAQQLPVVTIKPDLEEIRVNMSWASSETRGGDDAISPAIVLSRLKMLLELQRKTEVRIDGGGLGIVRFNFSPVANSRAVMSKADARKVIWLSAAMEKTDRDSTLTTGWAQRRAATNYPRLLRSCSSGKHSRWSPMLLRILRRNNVKLTDR